jgi:hypothetical protein
MCRAKRCACQDEVTETLKGHFQLSCSSSRPRGDPFEQHRRPQPARGIQIRVSNDFDHANMLIAWRGLNHVSVACRSRFSHLASFFLAPLLREGPRAPKHPRSASVLSDSERPGLGLFVGSVGMAEPCLTLMRALGNSFLASLSLLLSFPKVP